MKELKASLSGIKSGFLLHQKEEKLAMRPDAGPKPNQLPEDHRLFLQKEEEELAMRPVSPWDIPSRGGCAQTHTVPSIQKRPVASDLTPPHRWPLLPCFHKASSRNAFGSVCSFHSCLSFPLSTTSVAALCGLDSKSSITFMSNFFI